MAKAKPVPSSRAKPVKKPAAAKRSLLKTATTAVKAAAKLVKAATRPVLKASAKSAAPAAKAAAPAAKSPAPSTKSAAPSAKAAVPAKALAAPAKPAAAAAPAAKVAGKAGPSAKGADKKPAATDGKKPDAPATGKKGKGGREKAYVPPPRPVQIPRATKLPNMGEPLTKRELEQILTAGAGRGVVGEGSLKGRLVVKDGLPTLLVVGRDKRELQFLLQGPDQEVLPAYLDHKVSVTGFIKKTTNYDGIIDVRKYSAKKPETEAVVETVPAEEKLRYLSPGDIEQMANAGMGAGMKGYGTLRGTLEMTGDEFFIVCSGGGTRHQVSFILEGKGAKGLRKHVGHTVVATGSLEKSTGWGGRIQLDNFEPRLTEYRAVSRDGMEVTAVENIEKDRQSVDVKLNHGLTVRLSERAGHTWAIEPTMAKRIGLREANFEPASSNAGTREFFFTPRNPGTFEVEFFLAKALAPAQVSKSATLTVNVKP